MVIEAFVWDLFTQHLCLVILLLLLECALCVHADDIMLFVAVLPYEKIYLDNIPSAESYEQSYMHRDVISHVFVTK